MKLISSSFKANDVLSLKVDERRRPRVGTGAGGAVDSAAGAATVSSTTGKASVTSLPSKAGKAVISASLVESGVEARVGDDCRK